MTIQRISARGMSAISTSSGSADADNMFATDREAPSSTPSTSINDTASLPAGGVSQDRKEGIASIRQIRRVRLSVDSYNENILSGKSRSEAPASKGISSRVISGETLVDGGKDQNTHSQPLRESIKALDLDWTMGSMPGDRLPLEPTQRGSDDKRKSTRLDLLGRAFKAAMTTKSSLGKRGREVAEAGREKLHALGKRASLRSRGVRSDEQDDHVAKRAKLQEDPLPIRKASSTTIKQASKAPRTKIWLEKGLYAGQVRDSGSTLTGRMSWGNGRTDQQVLEIKSMPLPMFAGERLLGKGKPYKLPFNIFSPLPPGQPKPEEWKRTRGNVFVGDAADTWKKSKRLEHSTCICEVESGCDENCFNRFMFYECDDNNCNIGAEHCKNRSFEDLRQRCKIGGKYRIGVEVTKTKDRGYGVRSNRSFDSGQIIVEYTGEIVTQDECERRTKSIYKDNQCFYLMVFDQNMIIDATRGSIARFVNHSCEPNCKMVKWNVAGKPRMALFAGEDGIMTGDELTYDYNFDPFSSKSTQECRCGRPSCRGILGPRPKDIKEAMKPMVKTTSKQKTQKSIKSSLAAAVTEARKLRVPSSVKSALGTAKWTASKRLTRAKILSSSTAQNTRLMKTVSAKSLGSMRGMKIEASKSAKVATSSRRSSARTLVEVPAARSNTMAQRMRDAAGIKGLAATKVVRYMRRR